jgi:heme-degrading monooxygenase HmoA
MCTRLPLHRYRSIPGFLLETQRVRRQLKTTEGLVGYSLKTDLPRRRFFTMSAWADEASLHRFTATEPHRSVMRRLRDRMGETGFKQLSAPGTVVPPTWHDALAALGDG